MTNLRLAFSAVAFALLAAAQEPALAQAADQAGPSIRLAQREGQAAGAYFEVVGIAPDVLARWSNAKLGRDQWSAIFGVYVDHGTAERKADQPPLLGSYRGEGGRRVFEPRYPLQPGLKYRAVFHGPGAASDVSRTLSASFAIPREKPAAPTVVERVYPTRNRLPENQLKFYIHFSAPMSRGEAYRHVCLLDAAGKPVDLPFLELEQELWDPDGKRFTLFFDPGRIKRGLKPREEVGPVLEEGKRYTLVVDRAWPDGKGNLLRESYRKSFRVLEPDDEPVNPEQWKIEPPPAGQAAPLVVNFPEPLDHALSERLITVTDSSGKPVAGTVAVENEETRWVFKPERPWQPGRYSLVVDTTLEDLAGNQIGKPFEVDVFRRVQRDVKAKYVTRAFEVRPN